MSVTYGLRFDVNERGTVSLLLPDGVVVEDIPFRQKNFYELFELVTPCSSEFKKKAYS